jgi:hypothetical protein
MMANQRIPNLFLIGAPRCGTTALATYLGEHPRVYFSVPKEPFYWSSDFATLRQAVGITNLTHYLQLFSRGVDYPIVAEGSTSYLQSHVAVQRIREFNPDAKFIAMVRNPLEMAYSRHQQLAFSFQEDIADFEQAWRLQARRQDGEAIPPMCRTPEFLQYGEQAKLSGAVERFFQTVPSPQRHVIVFDDFVQNTLEAYQTTLKFLGIPDDGRRQFPKIHDQMKYRFRWLHRFVRRPPRAIATPLGALRRAVHRKAPQTMLALRRVLRAKQMRQPLEPDFSAELRDYFRDDVIRLSTILERDLMHWVRN